MRLSQMRILPTQAGQAVIRFSKDCPYPRIRNGTITLPHQPAADFRFLQNREQFLVALKKRTESKQFFVWLGGTDEAPFLTELRRYHYHLLKRRGEKTFYRSFVPQAIQGLQAQFGLGTVRQGDIHAAALPVSWEELVRLSSVFAYDQRPIRVKQVKNRSVFGTRHKLTGKWLEVCVGSRWGDERILFAEGVLTAPNHAPKQLRGPHRLEDSFPD